MSRQEKTLKYMLIAPAFIFLATFTIYPFICQIYLSFTNASIYNYRNPQLAGINNYKYILYDPGYFWQSAIITLAFVSLTVCGQIAFGMLMALLVFSLRRARKIITTLFLFPLFTAPVFIGALGRLIFNSMIGVIPYYFRILGLPSMSLSDPLHAFLIVATLEIWKWTPFCFIILYAGLESIPSEIFDAAKIDGAPKFKHFFYITLPLLKSIITILIAIRIMDELKAFDIAFILVEGGPGSPIGATTTFSLFVYKFAFTYNSFGIASAINVIILLFMLSLFWLLINIILRKG